MAEGIFEDSYMFDPNITMHNVRLSEFINERNCSILYSSVIYNLNKLARGKIFKMLLVS